MKLTDKRNGFNVKVMSSGKVAHHETKCVYSKEMDFVAVYAYGINEPSKGEVSVMNGDKVVCSGFQKSVAINTAPDGDICTSVIIYYNNDNLSDIISLLSLESPNNYHRRLNTINKTLNTIDNKFKWLPIVGCAIIIFWLILWDVLSLVCG